MAQHGDMPQKVADLAASLEIDPMLLSKSSYAPTNSN